MYTLLHDLAVQSVVDAINRGSAAGGQPAAVEQPAAGTQPATAGQHAAAQRPAAGTRPGAAGPPAAGGQRYRRTPSMAAALAAELPPASNLHGVQPSTSQPNKFVKNVAALAHSASVSGLMQQQAAVAHDLVANWRLHVLDVQHHSQDNTLNFPAVGYRQDEALMGQLRMLRSVHDMRAFLLATVGGNSGSPKLQDQRPEQQQALSQQERQRREREERQEQQRAQRRMQRMLVVGGDGEPDGEPEAATAAAAAAAAAEGDPKPVPLVGSRKRKQQAPVRVPQLQAASGADMVPGPPWLPAASALPEAAVEGAHQRPLPATERLQASSPSPAAGPVSVGQACVQQAFGSGAAGAPAYQRTPSIEAALAAALPPQLHGVHKYSSGRDPGMFKASVSCRGQATTTAGLTQQQAAVAHDLIVTWRVHARHAQSRQQNNNLNFPAAGYGEDEALMCQLRQLRTIGGVKAFVDDVVQQEPRPSGTGAALAAAKAGGRAEQAQQQAQQQVQQQQAQHAQQQAQQQPALARPEQAAMQQAGEDSQGSLPPTRPVSPAGEAGEAEAEVQVPGLPVAAEPPPPPRQELPPQHSVPQAAGAAGAAAVAAGTAGAAAGLPTPQPRARAGAPVGLPQPSPSGVALLAAQVAEAAQRKVDQAVQAFVAADRDSPPSMLRPLQHLLRALGRKGGAALQEVVAGWAGYSLTRQQEVFDAAAAVATEGDWGQLEGQLRLALDLTAEG